MGRPFAAVLKLNDEQRIEFDFGQARPEDEGGEAPDFSAQQPLGACPKCGARVYDSGMAYVCEKAVGSPRTCDFRSGKIILQQPIEREQMEKLLATGKTDLLNRFISKKGRPFKAFLVKTPGGKIGFEFQARVAKPGAVAKTAETPVETETPVVPLKKAAAKTKPSRIATKAKAPANPVVERHGVVLAWHDDQGRPPSFDIPDVDTAGWSPLKHHALLLRSNVQEIAENGVDIGHFVTGMIQTLPGVKDTFTLIAFKAFT